MRTFKETGSSRMIGVKVRINDIADTGSQTHIDKAFDLLRFFRVDQRVDYDCPFRGHYDASRHLGVKITRKDIDVVGDTFSLHNALLSHFELKRENYEESV